MDPFPISIVEYYGQGESHGCGYCHGEDGSISHGVWAHRLSCEDYQDMIDRGWRRSGKYCYKPIMHRTCCPMYTISCQARKFKPTRSMKQVLKRFRRFILTGEKPQRRGIGPKAPTNGGQSEAAAAESNLRLVEARLRMDQSDVPTPPTPEVQPVAKPGPASGAPTTPELTAPRDGVPDGLADLSRGIPPGMKRKTFRKLRSLQRHNGVDPRASKTPKNREKTLEELTSLDWPSNARHKFTVKTVPAHKHDPRFKATAEQSLAVYKKYQTLIHKDEPDKITRSQWERFLCNASLISGVTRDGGQLGAFHQQYWLDDQLICVGVVDFLPKCVSSVYLYYDPDFDFLSLGTLSALFELALVRSLEDRYEGRLLYYYMGYYIHSCPKMRYKSKFQPSHLLCPETYAWVRSERALPILDQSQYARLSEPDSADPREQPNIDEVLVYHNRLQVHFKEYKRVLQRVSSSPMMLEFEEAEIEEYAHLVGKPVFRSMLLYRS